MDEYLTADQMRALPMDAIVVVGMEHDLTGEPTVEFRRWDATDVEQDDWWPLGFEDHRVTPFGAEELASYGARLA